MNQQLRVIHRVFDQIEQAFSRLDAGNINWNDIAFINTTLDKMQSMNRLLIATELQQIEMYERRLARYRQPSATKRTYTQKHLLQEQTPEAQLTTKSLTSSNTTKEISLSTKILHRLRQWWRS